jgi:hypothetical protein
MCVAKPFFKYKVKKKFKDTIPVPVLVCCVLVNETKSVLLDQNKKNSDPDTVNVFKIKNIVKNLYQIVLGKREKTQKHLYHGKTFFFNVSTVLEGDKTWSTIPVRNDNLERLTCQ